MAEEKPTLFRLTKTLDAARRHHAAGNKAKAEEVLRRFKTGAQEVLLEQQREMVKDMNHHLKLRSQLKEVTSEATALAKEMRGEPQDKTQA